MQRSRTVCLTIAVFVAFSALLLAGAHWWRVATGSEPSAAVSTVPSRPLPSPRISRDLAWARQLAAPERVPLSGHVAAGGQRVRVCASCVGCKLISPENGPICVDSDANGNYELNLPPGEYRVTASAAGHGVQVLTGTDTLSVGNAKAPRNLDGELAENTTRVSGQVVDITGGPVAGATVRANFCGDELTPLRPVSQEALSGDDGTFTLGVLPGPVRVMAFAEGYAVGDVSRTAPSDHLRLVLAPASSVSGTVVDAQSNKTVANVEVTATTGMGLRRTTLSDAQGRFAFDMLRPGAYSLRAEGTGLQGTTDEPVLVDVLDQRDDVVVPVHRAAVVTGEVIVEGVPSPCPLANVELHASTGASFTARSEEGTGNFRFEAIPPGTYLALAVCQGYGRSLSTPLTISTEGLHGVVLKVGAGITLEGLVRDVTGAPVRNTQVRIVPEEALAPSDTPPIEMRMTFTDAEGRFSEPGVSPGRYRVTTRYLEEPVWITVGHGESNRVELIVRPVGRIAVDVISTDADTGALQVTVATATGAPIEDLRSMGGGRYESGPLGVGHYRVFVADARNPTVETNPNEGVEVQGGNVTEVRVSYGGFHGSLAGRVLSPDGQPVGGARVMVMPADASARQFSDLRRLSLEAEGGYAITEPDGAFIVHGLDEQAEFRVEAEHALAGKAVVPRAAPGCDNLKLIAEATL